VVQAQPPVGDLHDHVHEEHEADHDVGGGEEGRHQRAEEERRHRRPVEGERAEAEALHAGPDLLRRDRLGEDPADPRHGRQRREEVPRHGVPQEAARERHQEELGP
jgi:hypothetical protein